MNGSYCHSAVTFLPGIYAQRNEQINLARVSCPLNPAGQLGLESSNAVF